MRRVRIGRVLAVWIIAGVLHAQAVRPEPQILTQPSASRGNIADQLRPNYVLQVGDQISLRAFEMPEVSDHVFRIESDGFLNLPELGRVKAAGVSIENLEMALVESAKNFVRTPQVTLTVVQFSSQPVFFVGAFKAPGIYPLGGQRNLVEMRAAIGGLLPTANRRIKVTRRREYGAIPLASTVIAADGSNSVEIGIANLRDNVNPSEDLILLPFDVISVDEAEKVYVAGEVTHVGAFDLLERDSMSVIQALTLAGGLSPTANTKGAAILRPVLNTSRRAEIPLNLERILKGEDNDRPLLPNDVLYIPKNSGIKSAGRAVLVALPVAAAVATILYNVAR